jgi:hypothetical protein
MLQAHDINSGAIPNARINGTEVKAVLNLTAMEMRPIGGIVTQAETIEQTQQRLKAQIWRSIYGDVAKELQAAKRIALYNATPGTFALVGEAFTTLENMLENPFIGVPTDKQTSS